MSFRRLSLAFLFVFATTSAVVAQPIASWSAPPTWTPPRAVGLRPLANEEAILGSLPFIPITPCRQYNSTGSPLLQGVNRAVTLTGAPCGIPSAVAVSVNITVFNITGATGNGVFKVDTVTPPAVAWINYPPTETQRGNAGTVALNGSGQIVVQVAQGAGQVDFIVDVNGYYSSNNSLTGGFDVNNNSQTDAAIRGANSSPNCSSLTSSGCGVSGITVSTVGGYGVAGFAISGSGANYGVFGTTSSTSDGTGGVLGYGPGGRAVAPADYTQAGVRGESASGTRGYGVLGVSRSSGVGAALVNGTGSQLAYALLATASGPINYAVYAGGNFGGTGAKYFVEPHPTDPSQVIRYVSLEGQEAGTYFRGRGKFHNGTVAIELPEDFRMVTDSEGLSIQVTPIGEFANVAIVRIDLDGIVVKASRNVEFFYTVNGVRKTHKDLKPIGPGNEFVPQSADAKMPAYLTEGQKAMLISNGTYREDGTVNLETARRLGWEKTWEAREAGPLPR